MDLGDGHAAGLQRDHEEDQVPLEPGQREHLDGEQIAGREALAECACRTVFQGMRRLRSGAGSIPWSCRIRVTVVRAISWPRCESAPRIRVYPHWGFSTAIRTTRAATSRRGIGRPRPRRALPSYRRPPHFE